MCMVGCALLEEFRQTSNDTPRPAHSQRASDQGVADEGHQPDAELVESITEIDTRSDVPDDATTTAQRQSERDTSHPDDVETVRETATDTPGMLDDVATTDMHNIEPDTSHVTDDVATRESRKVELVTEDESATAEGETEPGPGNKADDAAKAATSDIETVSGIAMSTDGSDSNDEAPIGLVAIADPVTRLCEEVGTKLGSVSIEDCLNQNLIHATFTATKRSLAFKDYQPLPKRKPLGRVLVIGGIHGDEFSSVSVIMKWMKILDEHHSGLFHWRFVPAANPDGLLSSTSKRQNHNGVDLNRNFPTADWDDLAWEHWEQKAYRNPRRHPGSARASELETQWLVKQIAEFKPDAIISMHAPHHLVDYDGPPSAPQVLGGLYLRPLGVYPGSLGNYAGIDLKLPIVTVELQSAGSMPSTREIDRMWRDLVRWLRDQLSR
jgi:hypothetical protein